MTVLKLAHAGMFVIEKASVPPPLVVVGTKHTIETDGFSYLRSDIEELQFTGDERNVYEEAIRGQDAEFLGACHGRNDFIPWSETVNLIRLVKQYQALSGAQTCAQTCAQT